MASEMQAPAMRIRAMAPADMDTALAWAAREGWNPGLGDGPLLRALDPGGFLVGTVAGEPAAVISVARYAGSFAFLGLYIVRPDLRGRGYGLGLWRAGLARAGGRTVGLDGVVARQDDYRRGGFAAAHRILRFSGVAAPGPVDPRALAWDGADAEGIAAFDAGHHAAPRAAFARGWLRAPGHRVRVARRDGTLVGYGVARPCREGFKLGPLLARTPDVAEALFSGLAADCGPGAVLAVDVPEPNAAALRLAEARGLRPVFEMARMYRGPAPDLPLDRIHGVTSVEVG